MATLPVKQPRKVAIDNILYKDTRSLSPDQLGALPPAGGGTDPTTHGELT